MKKFDLQTYLDHPEKKVVTRDGRPVEILSVTCKVRESQPILAQIQGAKQSFTLEYYYKDGTTPDKNYNLFFADEEPELTEFEQCLKSGTNIYVEQHRHMEDFDAKEDAKELLELARKELEPEVLERLEVAYKNQDEVVYENGKRDALKDLPRWKSHGAYAENPTLHFEPDNRALLSYRGRVIFIDDLEKLPGFKEE